MVKKKVISPFSGHKNIPKNYYLVNLNRFLLYNFFINKILFIERFSEEHNLLVNLFMCGCLLTAKHIKGATEVSESGHSLHGGTETHKASTNMNVSQWSIPTLPALQSTQLEEGFRDSEPVWSVAAAATSMKMRK